MYYNYTSNIKYVGLNIKYIYFESFYYIVNLDDILSFVIFSHFDLYFYRCIVSFNK